MSTPGRAGDGADHRANWLADAHLARSSKAKTSPSPPALAPETPARSREEARPSIPVIERLERTIAPECRAGRRCQNGRHKDGRTDRATNASGTAGQVRRCRAGSSPRARAKTFSVRRCLLSRARRIDRRTNPRPRAPHRRSMSRSAASTCAPFRRRPHQLRPRRVLRG